MGVTPLRADPSRTSPLRRRFRADMRKRFLALRKAIIEMIKTDDAFGIKPDAHLVLHGPIKQVFRFLTDPQKMKSFQKWFQGQVDQKILSTDAMGKPWTAKYVDSAYRQGVVRAYIDTHKEALAPSSDFYAGSQAQFLRSSFAAPETVSKLELLSTRAYDQLKGITETMSQGISRTLASGLANGLGVGQMTKNLVDEVSGIERKRAEVLVRTEIIHTHAEGQLDAFEALGAKEVGVMAEWSTAGDEKVCPQCHAMEGVVLPIDKARDMIPRHPNCRCTFIPASDTEESTVKEIEKSIKESLTAGTKDNVKEAVKESTWVGAEEI